MHLHVVDLAILGLYLVGILSLGLFLRRRAARSIEDYFLAGRRLHWLAISMSASVSTYDITGTMWICAMFYTMGLKGMWIHWSWGFMGPAAAMAFGAKWVRRSNVITAAEWLTTRFGNGTDTRIARLTFALITITHSVGMIGYAFQGIGKFVSVYLPVSEAAGAFLVIGVTTIYVILGGLYSVIFTDVLQTVILTIAAAAVAMICYFQVSYDTLAAAVPPGWMDLCPTWRPDYLANTDYQFFGLLCIAWVSRGLLIQASGPGSGYDFQRFLSTRSPSESCKVAAAWPFFLVTRWGMCMGITALALLGFQGMSDPEKVLPHVLNTYLPIGLKGIVLAGFIAAFMSTFDSTINNGASYVVKDIYHAFLKPKATHRELRWAGYLSSLLIVLLGILVGLKAESITTIWNWILMVLGAGTLVPSVLRWYWWRFNAWGVVGCLASGMVLCFVLTVFFPDASPFTTLYVIGGGSLVTGIAATLLSPPTDEKTLCSFYSSVRPGGFWRPIRELPAAAVEKKKRESFTRDVINCIIAMGGMMCLYLAPMYAVMHRWPLVAGLTGGCLAAILILSRTWYPYLPKD